MARRSVVIVCAAVIGIGVFAVAVILTARPDIFNVAGEGSQCRSADRMASAVTPFAVGDMVGFQPIPPADITALPFDGTGDDARTIADLKGRTTLFNLWATWCAPCRIEMPHLAALHEAKTGDDFAVVAVSIDNRDANRPENFLTETNAEALDYFREPTMRLFNSLNAAGLAAGMPTTLLIAPDGCAAGVLHGAAVWDGGDAQRLIDAAVASTKS
ncbi:MAG: TlpA disulfide reductase family protein [Pseudomonadota bacterium]